MIKKIFRNMGIVRRNIYIPHIYVYYQHARYKYIYIYIAKKKKVVKEKYFAYEEGQGIW